MGWGIQLPIQSQSGIFVAPWEREAGPAELLAVAQSADRAGASYVAVCDHVAIPDDLVASMGAVWYDTVATIGWLAAHTTRTNLLSHVYVLPYRPFPSEPPTLGTGDFDLYRPYLHTNDIRWSYGGMRGRDADWEQALASASRASIVSRVRPKK